MKCDFDKIEDPIVEYNGDDECIPKLTITSRIGCRIGTLNDIWKFLEDNPTIFAIIMIAAGFFFTFFGYRLLIVTLFLLGFLLGIVGTSIIAYGMFVKADSPTYYGWIVLGVGAVIGLVIGFLLARFRKVGVFFIGAWGGVMLALVLNNILLYRAESEALFWVSLVAGGLIMGVLSYFIFVYVAILGTSFLGAYSLIRGVSMFAGHFPNEFTLIQ